MARVNISGFETGNADQEFHTYGGTISFSTTTKRSGTYAFRANPTTTAIGHCRITAYDAQGLAQNSAINAPTLYERFYFYVATLPASGEEMIARNSDSGGSRKAELRLTSAGNLTFYDTTPTLLGTSSTALVTGQWYRIEMEVGTGASATPRLYIDGIEQVSSTTANLRAGNNGMAILGKLVDISSQTIDVFYDDFAIDNAALPGAGEVVLLVPTANSGTMQWTGGTGASDYQEIDEVPFSAADYVKSSGLVDSVAMFVMADLSVSTSATVHAVKITGQLRLDTVGTNSHEIFLDSGPTTDFTTVLATTTSGSHCHKVYATDPNTSAAWTVTAVNDVLVGARERTTVLTRLLNLHMQVEVRADPPTPIVLDAVTVAEGTTMYMGITIPLMKLT
jgi:hypothetical protein